MSEDSDDIESPSDWVMLFFNFLLLVLAMTIAFVIIEFVGGYLDPYVTEEMGFVSCLVQFVAIVGGLLLVVFFVSFTPLGQAWLELDEEDDS